MKNNDLLYKQLNHAYETVPYYKKLFDDYRIKSGNTYDFSLIPLLRKDIVSNNEDSFISEKYKHKYNSGNLTLRRTSGSTGQCMNVYWLPSDYFITNIEPWKYRNKWYDISINSRGVNFHSTLYINNNFVYSPKKIIKQSERISFCKTELNEENIHLYIKEIEDFSPDWMSVQPSVLHAILIVAKYNEIDILNNIKYIELMSEYLHKNTRKYFEDCLPKVKFSNMYGTTETGCISLECPYGNQHIFNNAFIEIFDNNFKDVVSEEGNIVLTSLRNNAMPFIRYCIGDKGGTVKSSCKCGYEGYNTHITLGREGDIIELSNGYKKHVSILLHVIEEICSEYESSILQFYFIQEELNSFRVFLSIRDKYKNWIKSIEESIRNAMKKYLYEDVNCVFAYNFDNLLNDRDKLNIFVKNFK